MSAGLIPAHAGKTTRPAGTRAARRTHPRSRGENLELWPDGVPCGDSSPLTRGKRKGRRHSRPPGRLIPAHAGKTLAVPWTSSLPPTHPRSRGENLDNRERAGDHADSSPLTRGKRFLTCAFTAQIDQILESLELAVSSGSYSIWVACATDAPQDQVQSIGLVLPSSRDAS